jgi:hypothetical protein
MEKLADMFRGTGVERMARFLDEVEEHMVSGEPLPMSGPREGEPVKPIYLTAENLACLTFVKTGGKA